MISRIIKLAALLLFVGCASRPTLDQLRDEALITGDWSAVEAREARITKHNAWDAAVKSCQSINGLLRCDKSFMKLDIERDCVCLEK